MSGRLLCYFYINDESPFVSIQVFFVILAPNLCIYQLYTFQLEKYD